MEYIIYIGAALVIGLLVGFVALTVTWLRRTMLRNVRSHTLNLISVYDDILDEKSQELSSIGEAIRVSEEECAARKAAEQTQFLQEQSPAGVAPAIMLSIAEQAAEASYRDSAIGMTYHQIRENFSFNVDEVVPSAALYSVGVGGPAGNLLDALRFETVYRLSTLSEQEQLEILRSSLPQESKLILDEYLQQHGQFDVFDFYDNLISRAVCEPKMAKLFVPKGTCSGRTLQSVVDIAEDGEICEGFQFEADGKLYDYCIKTKELC